MTHAPAISSVRRDTLNANINAAETAKPIHEARVTVIASANTSPTTATTSNKPNKLFFCENTRNKPNASDAISCNTSAYVTQ